MSPLPYQAPDRGWCGDPGRGAAMGRPSDLPDDAPGPLHIRRVPLDGDYDPGGTYWGGGGEPLFCVWDDDDRVSYLRAADLDAARTAFPDATWAPEGGPTAGDVADMVEAYLTAAFFTSTDESNDAGGEPLDSNYSPEDLDDASRAELAATVEAFAAEHGTTIAACVGKRGPYARRECDWSLAGHCLWMAQAGTGCGFTDGDWPKAEGKILDAAASAIGEAYLYVGDDGKIHCE